MEELRAGYAPQDFAESAEPAARAAFAQSLAVLRDSGLKLVETKLPDFPYGPVIGTIIAAEGASVFEPLISSGRVNELADQKQIAGLKAGLEITAKDYLKAMRIRRLIKDAIQRMFADVDLLLAPSRRGPAGKIVDALDRPTGAPEAPGMTMMIPAGNLAGMPAISLPCGFAEGLPVAIQLVGLPYAENTLVAVGREFQKRTDWHRRKPPGM
jgi:Asp-tRNA(Asn)/Glu-tRNA(Gln) amidotransferase A subunit family amidase